MKRNSLIIVVGLLLVVIFGFWLCAFQVRTTEVAVVTTFGKATRSLTEPGLYFKLPPPIQRVYKFDQRIQSSEFENKFREDLTADNNPLLTSVYIGWRITEPGIFLQKFPGGIPAVEQQLANLVELVQERAWSASIRFRILSRRTPAARSFGALRMKFSRRCRRNSNKTITASRLSFSDSRKSDCPKPPPQKVFARMTSERNVLISRAQNEGEAQARIIRSDADLRASKILSAAQGEALRIQGQGEAEASQVPRRVPAEPATGQLPVPAGCVAGFAQGKIDADF